MVVNIKKKEKIKMEELDGETLDDMTVAVLLDAIIELLKKKDIITNDEIGDQIKENAENCEKFIEEHPGLTEKIKEDIIKKQEEKALSKSYIG